MGSGALQRRRTTRTRTRTCPHRWCRRGPASLLHSLCPLEARSARSSSCLLCPPGAHAASAESQAGGSAGAARPGGRAAVRGAATGLLNACRQAPGCTGLRGLHLKWADASMPVSRTPREVSGVRPGARVRGGRPCAPSETAEPRPSRPARERMRGAGDGGRAGSRGARVRGARRWAPSGRARRRRRPRRRPRRPRRERRAPRRPRRPPPRPQRRPRARPFDTLAWGLPRGWPVFSAGMCGQCTGCWGLSRLGAARPVSPASCSCMCCHGCRTRVPADRSSCAWPPTTCCVKVHAGMLSSVHAACHPAMPVPLLASNQHTTW